MDDNTNLKKNVDKYQKNDFTYSADGKQFKPDSVKNLLISVSN